MRNNLKRLLSLVMTIAIVVTMSVSLTGCQSSGEQEYAWVLATASPEDTVTQLYAEKFAEEVYARSDGKMKIEVYPNSSLGGDTDLLESCMSGDIPFVVQNTAPQVSYMPKLAIFDLPCVFKTIDDLYEVLDNEEFMTEINKIYQTKGIRLLAMSDQNFRVMSSNVKVESLEDFTGIKIRTMENANHIAFWKSVKANPSPMAFAEVYIGLQQHTIDAQENPYEVIVSNKFYEQQDYVIQTNHLPHLLSLITNEEFLKSLPEDQQQIILESAQVAKEYASEQAQARVNDRIQICKDGGAEIIEVSDEMFEQMRAGSASLYDSIRKQVDNDALFNIYTGK